MQLNYKNDAAPEDATESASRVSRWLDDQLRRGTDEAALLQAITIQCRADPNIAWEILSQLDQYYRRGRLPDALFHSLKRHTEQLGVQVNGPLPGMSGSRTRESTLAAHPNAPSLALPKSRAAAMPIGVGKVLRHRYELQGLLGEGGLGAVYKALDRLRADLPPTEQHVAIKLLRDSGQASAGPLGELMRECRLAQSLSHPNIVRVYDVDRDGECAFLVMELLRGMSLRRLLQDLPERRLRIPDALAVIRDVGAAVAYSHSRHVIHGDLKPANVMLDYDGTVRVLDFGVSRRWRREPWISDHAPGSASGGLTPLYASCEQLDGQQTEPRDDLYALGCIAYELLAGEHPYGRHIATEAQRLEIRVARPPGLTGKQWRALRCALAFDRDARPSSVLEWMSAMELGRATQQLPPASVLMENRPPATHGGTARWLAIAAGITAVLGIAYWFSRPDVRVAVDQWRSRSVAAVAAATGMRFPGSDTRAQASRNNVIVGETTTSIATPPPAAAKPVVDASPAVPPVAAPAAAAMESTATLTTATADDGGSATIALAGEETTVSAGDAAAWVTVQRRGSLREAAAFSWWVVPGSARPGSDYIVDGPQRARFAAGQSTTTLFIPLVNDPTRRADVDFQVRIGVPAGGLRLEGIASTRVRIARR